MISVKAVADTIHGAATVNQNEPSPRTRLPPQYTPSGKVAFAAAKPAANKHVRHDRPVIFGPARNPTVPNPDPISTSTATRPATEPAVSGGGSGRIAGCAPAGAGGTDALDDADCCASAVPANSKSHVAMSGAAPENPRRVIRASPATCG